MVEVLPMIGVAWTFGGWLVGRYDPSLPLAFRLARVFSTTIEELFIPDEGDLGETASSVTSTG